MELIIFVVEVGVEEIYTEVNPLVLEDSVVVELEEIIQLTVCQELQILEEEVVVETIIYTQ